MKPHNPLQGFDPAKHELYAKSACNKCHGRGYVGKNLTTKEYQECLCLRYRDKVAKTEPDPRPYELMVEPVQSAPVSVVEYDEIGSEA